MIPLIILLFIFFTSPAHAADYYVSPSGSDTNPGTLNLPFQTIQKGINLANNPGDQILVLPGEYKLTDNYIYAAPADIRGKHGVPGNEIVLKAYDPDQKPLIRGFHGIRIVGSSYLIVDGFEITDTSRSAISITSSDHITLKNNYLHLDFEGFCIENEPPPYAGCTYYPSLGIGEIKGRHDKNGQIIVEHDGVQNPGIYICKAINNVISHNRIENYDESIYVGKAGDVGVSDCDYPQYDLNRTWVEGNLISDNLIVDSWNEAIELKPDTRFNHVKDNVIKSTRPFVETSQIEIRGHDNEVSGNLIVGSPNTGIRILSETVSDPDGDRVEKYKKPDGSYMSAYRNFIHHNYIYSWAQYSPSSIGIVANESSAANTISHNTLVGINEFTGKVSQYSSIKSNAFPENIILDNLMVGLRRVDYTVGSEKYESHLTSYSAYLPQTSDYNAYFPRLKNNNQTCVVSLGTLNIICESNHSQNLSLGFEGHSQFLNTNPLDTENPLCLKDVLIDSPIESLRDRIHLCSTPLPGSDVFGTASDDTNIGASQNPAPPPLVSFLDLLQLIFHFDNPYTIFNFNSLVSQL